MSGVWVLENGKVRRADPPRGERKILVYSPTDQVIASYSSLERILSDLGWERSDDEDHTGLIQFHNRNSANPIFLPRDFSSFNLDHMYSIMAKNPGVFRVEDFY